ncbi:POTRA domain-containing protein [Tunturibacter empetritectus]|uniref:Outer membrane protein assembly factor BamA n=1 Tax=Tunturiibacter empetritectus TaxID=3069691 RepID=A0A7W8IGM4_9BACT|nr:POTRA domain-containing protein [Edaphobacter lichenicola]MBB5316760.1 outer membrane protein assembly factor BamA [Edaphobacter lichenicola]
MWFGLWLMAGAALGQAVPAASTPARTPNTVPSGATPAQGQQAKPVEDKPDSVDEKGAGLTTSLWQWKGLIVEKILFEGVTFDATDTLPKELTQKVGVPLDPQEVRASLRRLFASGRYRDISVRGIRQGDQVTLVFAGAARYYVGRVTIAGVKSERLTSLLEFATKLSPGTAFTEAQIPAGTTGIKEILQQQGYYEPQVAVKSEIDEAGDQVNVTYTVAIGPQARVGQIKLVGDDTGLTPEEFRKRSKLKENSKVRRDTTSNALDRLRKLYQKKNRLEATVSLQKQTYDDARDKVDYEFHASQGPEVKVSVEGAKISTGRLHLLVPIFEEGTIDNDLLNEGVFNIRDYEQQQGFFDSKVDVRVVGNGTTAEQVVFTVDRGVKHKVVAVDLKGNKYFTDDLLRERMRVQKSNAYQRSGRYSPALVSGDVGAIQALYRANGFDQAKVTTDVKDVTTAKNGKKMKVGEIAVTFTIVEGPQQKFGKVDLNGVGSTRVQNVRGLMNAQAGQPFSLVTLSGDRDTVLQYYLANGFDQVKVEIRQTKETADADKTDVSLNVTEGQQVFVNRVLLSGVEKTRPSVVASQILVHAGDPLDQTALLQTQRNLYNIALFNEVVAAVQNPAGDAPQKNVVLQLTEAKRWNVTYGFGFEAALGTPQTGTISEASCIQLGLTYPCNQLSPDGKPGVSPRVSLDVSRINLRGSEDSLTLHTTYGLLEQVATLTLQNPHLRGSKNFSAAISGGYSNVQDITTFQASTLQGDFRITEKFRRRDTFIYDFLYRRVKVNPNSLQVSADLIPLLSQPVRVGGPSVTWFHDTRSPGPLDAVKGQYSTVQGFVASSKFGSQTDFWKLDGTNSTYYQLGKLKYVFARETRIGYERASGMNPNAGSDACVGVLLTTNPSCNAIPLPERLYAGGANSHRGFPINGAGPRDLQTGFPVGGSAAFVNTFELRLPAQTLPLVGNNVNFVIFHDMGNVFQNAKDMFPSFTRFHQPDKGTCANVSGIIGTCSFNYFSHAVGLGARYRTPVGPIRVDFSYNLNPPVYPIIYDFNNNPPHEGQASHFNFFFSIGESF